ncbi:MAG: NADP-dependent oxidoreductase, partial [Bradyrhizobium sp.]|nr:NADP-dependent oxidoreductase [Bradyrhizobium sp.]
DCIDHRTVDDLSAALKRACPDGIDVYFENVGGDLQLAVFPLMNTFGRMIMCGMVAEYNDTVPRPGHSRLPDSNTCAPGLNPLEPLAVEIHRPEIVLSSVVTALGRE